MKRVLCDNHPDRPADATFGIGKTALGWRPAHPILVPALRYVDLCDECVAALAALTDRKPAEAAA